MLTWIADVTGARSAELGPLIQSLWSGYGEVRRVLLRLEGGGHESVVLKWVVPPAAADHPRGWTGDRSHTRKLRSYAVEQVFWSRVSARCDEDCRVPRCLASRQVNGEFQFVLEDLDASGYAGRRRALTPSEIVPCLRWLAAFHATFLGDAVEGLWPTGTYWHLETRPDELEATADRSVVAIAPDLDRMLTRARFQTVVHGDAKVANFCFGDEGVAAVDFQYVGGGVGMKDVAYLLSSCFDEADCERHAEACLDVYFDCLRAQLATRHPEVDAAALEQEWRELYPVAWADFVRFLLGWAPDHYKLHAYSRRMLQRARDRLTAC